MTNLEAVKSTVGINYPLEENTFLKALVDAGLTPEAEYVKESGKAVDLCAAALILVLLTSADVQEGGYRVSISERSALERTRKALLAKHGLSDGTGPVINGSATYLW